MDSLCIAGNPTSCSNPDRNECGDLYQSLKYSYNYHMDDCDEIMTLGLADVSHMSIFNDFDETDRNEFHGRIIDQFSMITVDSAPADNHESTLGTGANDLGIDTRANTTLYSGHGEGACGLFVRFIDTGNIAANISGSNCDHIYSIEDDLLSNCDHTSCVDNELLYNCDTKEKVDDETSSNCDTCMVEDESAKIGGENSISFDHKCHPLGLGNDFCDMDSVQDSLLEDMVSHSLSNKPSVFQKIWLILSDSLSYVEENMPICMTHIPSHGYHFKKEESKALYDEAKCNTPCRDNNDKYYDIQHGLKKDFEPHVDISATYLWSQDDAKSQATKTWFDMGTFPVDGRALHMDI